MIELKINKKGLLFSPYFVLAFDLLFLLQEVVSERDDQDDDNDCCEYVVNDVVILVVIWCDWLCCFVCDEEH